jgi:hypothetical protein
MQNNPPLFSSNPLSIIVQFDNLYLEIVVWDDTIKVVQNGKEMEPCILRIA